MNVSEIIQNFNLTNSSSITPNRQAGPPSRLVYSILFGVQFVIGAILNAFTIAVCLRKSLRKTPSFIITAFIGLSSIIILAMTALPNFIDQLTPYTFNSNLIWCKLSFYFQIFSYNWAGWLLVESLWLYLK